VKLARLRRPKIIWSPSYTDFRPKTNAVILLDMGHTLREEHIVGNPKLESALCAHCRGANIVILN
jgi:hypothetical protein